MRTKFLAFAALATVLTLAPAAFADNPSADTSTSYQAKDNGGYVAKEKSVSTDSAGTTTEHQATKKVTVDSNGNSTTKVDVKDSVDPKGLMNKSTTENVTKTEVKDGQTTTTHKKVVNGKTVNETDTTQQP